MPISLSSGDAKKTFIIDYNAVWKLGHFQENSNMCTEFPMTHDMNCKA